MLESAALWGGLISRGKPLIGAALSIPHLRINIWGAMVSVVTFPTPVAFAAFVSFSCSFPNFPSIGGLSLPVISIMRLSGLLSGSCDFARNGEDGQGAEGNQHEIVYSDVHRHETPCDA